MRGFSSPMRVTQEGPDGLSLYCPVRVIVRGNDEKLQAQEITYGKGKTRSFITCRWGCGYA